MTKRFTQSFKLQAVEKALNRPKETSLEEISENLRVGRLTPNNSDHYVLYLGQEFE